VKLNQANAGRSRGTRNQGQTRSLRWKNESEGNKVSQWEKEQGQSKSVQWENEPGRN